MGENKNTDVSKSQLRRIFQMTSLNSFGLGFVLVFIPVYFLGLGYSLGQVMSWFIVQDSVFIAFSFISVWCSNKIGLVSCLQIRFLFLISYLSLISYIPSYPYLLYVAAIIGGIEMSFFWIPLNILFVRNSDHGSMGQSISKLSAYSKALSILCPIVGAYIILHFNYNILFIIAMLIVLVASLPLWPLRSEKTNFKFTKQSVSKIWVEKKKLFLPEVISSFAETGSLILTLFIYLKFLSVVQIGIVGTLTAFTGVLFTITIGKLTDLWDKHRLIKISSVIASIIWIYCFIIGQIIPNIWLFYIATVAVTLTVKVFIVPYQSILFSNAKKDDAQFIVLREIPNIVGRIIVYFIAILFSYNLSIVFIISSLSFVYFWFLDTKKLVSTI